MVSDHRANVGLSPCQERAIANIKRRAERGKPQAWDTLVRTIRRAGIKQDLLYEALASFKTGVRVVLHFHPDRLINKGKTVADGLLADGIYRSQFETGISNGSPTAYAGGERDMWEKELFEGAYHPNDRCVDAVERPKYGSLELFDNADGPSPRFGSCYFVLRSEVSARSTFTLGDSHLRPETVGVLDCMEGIMAELLRRIQASGEALGVDGLTVRKFVRHLCQRNLEGQKLRADPIGLPVRRVLDDYIEAQIHGWIDLESDVEWMVIDPSFLGTETGKTLEKISERYNIALARHCGFVLSYDQVPSDFRGPTIPPLARLIAEVTNKSLLDAAAIGVAARDAFFRPQNWSEWGTYTEVLRRLRQMWHILVRYGQADR